MKTLVYSTHLPQNHTLISERIRRERPSVYLNEAPELLNAVCADFTSDRNMSVQELLRRCKEAGWGIEESRGVEVIFEAAREARAEIRCVESDQAAMEFSRYQAEHLTPLGYALGFHLPIYLMALKMKRGGYQPDDTLLDLLPQDPDETIRRFQSHMKKLQTNLVQFAKKDVERDRAITERIKLLADYDIFGYFGYAHRTVSHLLQQDGIRIPSEITGDIVIDPENKYFLLAKYEILGLDTAELRSTDPAVDCDPLQRQKYLELVPYWKGFEELNSKRFPLGEVERMFWTQLDKIMKGFG